MTTDSITGLSGNYLQSILNSALQDAGLTSGSTSNSASGISTSQLSPSTDNSRLSPLAQVLSTLQQLQQSNPAQYQQVTQQIATNLQTAANTAQSEGNTTLANQLNQLASDFTSASQSGQLPNIQDLAQAIGGHHHHHHHAPAAADATGALSANSSSSSNTSTGTNQTLSQFLATLQTGATQNETLNPLSVIVNTLSNAGILGSNS